MPDLGTTHGSHPPLTPTRTDRLRQITVTLAETFSVLGTLVGIGVLGRRVEETSGGALAADATLLAPAGPAFSIWTPIYLGLLGYTIWQWLPAQATAPRHRLIGWLAAASMALNAGWLLVTQQGRLWVSVAVIVALVVVLAVLLVRVNRTPAGGWADRILVDGTFGVYLGWVSVATAANVTAALVASGVTPAAPWDDAAAVLVLGGIAVVGIVLARRLDGSPAVAAAVVWGLVWIAVGRTAGEPRSLPTAFAALTAALIITAGALRSWRRRG